MEDRISRNHALVGLPFRCVCKERLTRPQRLYFPFSGGLILKRKPTLTFPASVCKPFYFFFLAPDFCTSRSRCLAQPLFASHREQEGQIQPPQEQRPPTLLGWPGLVWKAK